MTDKARSATCVLCSSPAALAPVVRPSENRGSVSFGVGCLLLLTRANRHGELALCAQLPGCRRYSLNEEELLLALLRFFLHQTLSQEDKPQELRPL